MMSCNKIGLNIVSKFMNAMHVVGILMCCSWYSFVNVYFNFIFVHKEKKRKVKIKAGLIVVFIF